jgi:hypothetical protein
MYVDPYVKYPLFLSDFNETRIFSRDFRKNTQMSNFMKIHPVGAELFHAAGQTDEHAVHDNAKSTFSTFCEIA